MTSVGPNGQDGTAGKPGASGASSPASTPETAADDAATAVLPAAIMPAQPEGDGDDASAPTDVQAGIEAEADTDTQTGSGKEPGTDTAASTETETGIDDQPGDATPEAVTPAPTPHGDADSTQVLRVSARADRTEVLPRAGRLQAAGMPDDADTELFGPESVGAASVAAGASGPNQAALDPLASDPYSASPARSSDQSGRGDATTVIPTGPLAAPPATPRASSHSPAASHPGDQFVSVSPAVRHAPGRTKDKDTSSQYVRGKRRKAPWIVLAAVLVVAGGYAAAAWLTADKVPAHTTVAGVDIGGMTSSQAVAQLDKTIGTQAAKPVDVSVNGASAQIDPKAAGLTFSAKDTVTPLVRLSFNPADVLRHFTGHTSAEPVTIEDKGALTAQVQALADATDVDPVEGAITIADGKAQVTNPQAGIALRVKDAAAVVEQQWLSGKQPLALPFDKTEPTIGQGAIDDAMKNIVDVVNSGPVTVTLDNGTSLELPSEAVMAAASLKPDGSKLVLSLAPDRLYEQVKSRLPAGVESGATDASFVFQNGRPVVQAGSPGRKIDTTALATAVTAAATSTTNRSVTATFVDVQPEQDAAALEALGVKEIVSQFSTHVPYDPVRTQNLKTGAAKITGDLVKPGETFSLTEALGPIDAAHGFQMSGVLQNGEHTEGMGGGLSQVSTTLYNASHLAGMVDVEHRPHSVWFTRYPAGREATLWVGQIDNKFKNDTPYGVVIQAWVDTSNATMNVALWSTHYWDVDSQIGPKTNIVPATVIHKPASATCVSQSPGQSGFTVTVTRTKSLNGQVKDTQSWKWTYKPDNGYACDAPAANAGATGGENQQPPD